MGRTVQGRIEDMGAADEPRSYRVDDVTVIVERGTSARERYTRLYDQQRQMDQVLRLSWAGVAADNTASGGIPQIAVETLGESRGVGAGGFEPP